MPEKVPLWIIRNTFCSYGSKMPGMPRVMTSNMKQCETCKDWLWEPKDWDFHKGKYYCNVHYVEAKEKDPYVSCSSYGSGYRPGIVRQMDRLNDIYPGSAHTGNLQEHLYQFWIGSPVNMSNRSICRACSTVCYGDADRISHRDKSKQFYKAQVSCWFVLTMAYKKILEDKKCVVCGGDNHGRSKWGVPICSLECVKTWKFDEDQKYPEIDLGMMDFWKVEERPGGSIILASSLNPPIKTVEEEKE